MVDITTTDSARAALERETEIGKLAARLRSELSWKLDSRFERGARAGLTAYRDCYELCVYIAAGSNRYSDYIGELVERAEAALEAAR